MRFPLHLGPLERESTVPSFRCNIHFIDYLFSRPHSIDGRQVQPKRAVPREDSSNPGSNMSVNKIFVGGIRDKPVEKEDLDAYFSSFGTIKECLIMTDKETGKSRGFAFVPFDDYDPVDKVVLQKYHVINEVNVEVKKAVPKDAVGGPAQNRGQGCGAGMGGPHQILQNCNL